MLERINAARAERGLPPLARAVQLEDAAVRHVVDLIHNPVLIYTDSHAGSDGSNIGDRVRRAGYRPAAWGEITGWGFNGDGDRMMAWWLNSPVHAAAILSRDVTEAGTAYVYAPGTAWGHYWTVDFGRPIEAG